MSTSTRQPRAAKHIIPRSSSTGPAKKKSRTESEATLLRQERERAKAKELAQEKEAAKLNKPTLENGIYRLFVLAERDYLEKELAEDVSGLKGGVNSKPSTHLLPSESSTD